MTVTGINHVGLTVSDLDRSLGFYRDLLGLRVRGRGIAEREHLDAIIGLGPVRLEWAELDVPGGGLLELFRYLRPEGTPRAGRTSDPGDVHVCLEVQDLDELVARLAAAGVPRRSAEAVALDGGDWSGWSAIYVSDPDGITVELVQPPLAP